jgi:hypothetical protein
MGRLVLDVPSTLRLRTELKSRLFKIGVVEILKNGKDRSMEV